MKMAKSFDQLLSGMGEKRRGRIEERVQRELAQMPKRRRTPKRQQWSVHDASAISSKAGLRPGTRAPVSGQYERIGARGRRTGLEATVTEGAPLPPTPRPGETWKLARRSTRKTR
jgi:hypothetical protein